ncbi:MAG: hypothetical protein ACP6IT_10105 [Candidatus Thorarchaeota archaeon]
MKSCLNCVACIGLLFFAVSGLAELVAVPLLFEGPSGGYISIFGGNDTLLVVAGAAVTMVLGLFLIYHQFVSVNKWNKVVGVMKAQRRISLTEASAKTGIKTEEIRRICYQAIAAGDISGTLEGDTFVRSPPTGSTASATAKVLVICPYCGGKTEQGLSKCQHCGAEL